ncbi:sensor histidine kinase [Virgisporangium aurantiacum]|uniref:histidine kinase n=1 Tax=Virgisporangium aurantiacum TaxID=175570 RepID=A0A8J4E7Q7_9ACTN|nr:sensor histidine kinase [Virgisporangium aurantiacum]GIJ64453.1 histidine kinase [Virgisporangium aurantiacum]
MSRLPATLRRRAGEALYALTDLPVALVGIVLAAVTVSVGIFFVPLFVGILVLAAGLIGARGWGRFERARAAVMLGERVAAPVSPPEEPARLGRWLRRVFTDLVSWRAVLYMVIRLPLSVVTTGVAVCVYGVAGITVSYPLWYTRTHMSLGSYDVDTAPRAFVTALIGLATLLLGPVVLMGPVTLCRLATRFLLGPSRLDGRVRALEQARGQAVDASATALRRIERDLHDGTQARLITLAMDLSLARDLLTDIDIDAESAAAAQLRTAVEAAHRNAQDAVVELRGVVANIHPPVLDTGLEPALHSLGQSLSIPVSVDVHVPKRPPPAVETIAYFCAVELLSNVVKHSGALTATVELTGTPTTLTLRITDNGAGGAAVTNGVPGRGGTGLAGLTARVATVDGALRISSPPGGPTTVTVELPTTV